MITPSPDQPATSSGSRPLVARFAGLYRFIVLFLILSQIIRLTLGIKAFESLDPSWGGALTILATGLLFDATAALYCSIPFALYLMLLPDRLFRHPLQRFGYLAIHFVVLYLLIFNGVSEWIFWDEFGVRYNFIAVDYLVYTHEVIGNIRQSYPVPLLLSAILAATVLISWIAWRARWLTTESVLLPTTLGQRTRQGIPFLLLPVIAFWAIDHSMADISHNRFHNELAKNGLYSLFSAFIHNELEYSLFYLQRDEAQAAARVRELLLAEPGSKPIPPQNPADIARTVTHPGPEKRLNVIQLTIESFSADFMGFFGNPEGLTPHLDRLAKESLTFTQLYATGNRTDRGMESLVLSVPPTPGRSKVKRPNNEGLFSSGELFRRRGYDTRFIYGGYGYFDNMNYFFGHNGFEVVDRTQLKKEEITQENIWGVADEDLFRRTIREADQAHAAGKPFYYFVMTTTNHRPFTYPDGRIDIPSPGGRSGAVKYTDWAVGHFLAEAKKHPWFDDTLFVITADHCAGSAGKTELPVSRYHIPLMIHAPRHLQPRLEEGLTSQIDITPTVLGLLGWSYDSRFFGQDVLRTPPEARRAFIGTYQKLGMITGDRLTILSPQQQSSHYRFERGWGKERQERVEQAEGTMLDDAIAFYQTANTMRHKKLDKSLP
ncbi:MAG: sulfatase-like hydrolase/transferase [Magnetococcales bacterium]|nr:sulfatase-like hydrolase/transferase [Magnetococcales bacterium]